MKSVLQGMWSPSILVLGPPEVDVTGIAQALQRVGDLKGINGGVGGERMLLF